MRQDGRVKEESESSSHCRVLCSFSVEEEEETIRRVIPILHEPRYFCVGR